MHAPNTTAYLRQLEQALQTMQLGVTITDVDGKIVYVNPADAHMHGYTEAELLGQDVGIFGPPERRSPLQLDQLRALSSWRRESMNVRKDGSTFPVQLLSDVVRDADGEPVGIVTTCEDITERRKAEEALRKAKVDLDRRVTERTQELSTAVARLEREIAERERAERAQRSLENQLRQSQKLEAVGQLTSGIAHDFNNILSVILANTDLISLTLPSTDPAHRASLQDIAASARIGAHVVDQLLGFSRQAELHRVPSDLAKVVVSQSGMLRHLIPEHIEIHTSTSEPIGAVRVDAGAVQQILMNLVTNARDAMPDGGTIRIDLDEETVTDDHGDTRAWVPPGRYARLTVTDTGLGMDQEVVSRVFEPFFTTKGPGKGTGLGMAMVYGLVQQHDGFVRLESEPGHGTTVFLHFPIVDEPAHAPALHHPERAAHGGTETVLFVEDDETLRRTGTRVLEKYGYRVVVAANGVEALTTFRERRNEIDLIITDVVMPKLGGPELIEAIATEDHAMKFLLVSGHTPRDVDWRSRVGASVPLLRKPWSLSELAARVREVLDS